MAPAYLIVFALKHGRQRGLEVIDQLVDRVLKCPRPAGGQFDGDVCRVCEIVDIDPIGSTRLAEASSARTALTAAYMPLGPMTNRLNPALSTSVPKRIASSARSCPTSPSIGSSSAVVANFRFDRSVLRSS